jgi:hypothetical protein
MFTGTPLSTITSLTNSYIQVNTATPPYSLNSVIVNLAPAETGTTITVRDIGGDPFYFYDSAFSIIIATTGSFTDGTSQKSITTPYGSMTLTAKEPNTWAPVFNEVLTSSLIQTISSLYISTNINAADATVTSTFLYGNLSTLGNIEVSGTFMLGPYSTFTVETMSNTFYNLATTSSYVSSLTFYNTMANLATGLDPYISTTTLDYVFKNIGYNYTYISTAQMVKNLGLLSSIYISTPNALNTQLTNLSSLIYNNTGVMATNSATTIQKWYGIRSQTGISLFNFNFFVLGAVYNSGGILFILTESILYAYNTTSRVATNVYSGFTDAQAMCINDAQTYLYICAKNAVYNVLISTYGVTSLGISPMTGIFQPAIFYVNNFNTSGTGGTLFLYSKQTGALGQVEVYNVNGVKAGTLGKMLNAQDTCTGIVVYNSRIYISSETQIWIYSFIVSGTAPNAIILFGSPNTIIGYTYSGPSADGYLTVTQYDYPPGAQPYISPIAYTTSISYLKFDGSNTFYFADNNKIRKLIFSTVPISGTNPIPSSIAGYSITTFAGSGAAGTTDGTGAAASFNFTEGGPLAIYPSATFLTVYDNINQIFRNITLPGGVVTTQVVASVTGAIVITNAASVVTAPIVDMVYANDYLYVLTPVTMQQYNIATQARLYNNFYFMKAVSMTYNGSNIIYVCDYLPPNNVSRIWEINLSTQGKRLFYTTAGQILTSFLSGTYLYYILGTSLSCLNVTTATLLTSPVGTLTVTGATSLVVTSTNIFVGLATGAINIYTVNPGGAAMLVTSTNVTVSLTIDGYGSSGFCTAFTSVKAMKADATGIYFIDTNCVRKLTWTGLTGNIVTIAGTGVAGIGNGDGDSATIDLTQYPALTTNNGVVYVYDNNNNIVRIINPASGNDRLSAAFINCTGTTTVNGYTVARYTGYDTGMTLVSDARMKNSIQPLTSSLDKISRLQGVSYVKIGEPQQRIGCIAQDVEMEYPEVVETDSNGMKCIYYDELTSPLVESVKELTQRVKQFQNTLQSRAR